MLKHGIVNPLNVHGMRELSHCPPHFERITFDSYVHLNVIRNWIYENLSSRFYIGEVDARDQSTRRWQRRTLIAFEEASEATIFALNLTDLNVDSQLLI